jgi:glycosyltransferase involved in cell wall biosynthesis
VSLNPGERLRRTLESILDQTFTDYEVIIKDGGSKDGSADFLKEEGILDYDRNMFRLL